MSSGALEKALDKPNVVITLLQAKQSDDQTQPDYQPNLDDKPISKMSRRQGKSQV